MKKYGFLLLIVILLLDFVQWLGVGYYVSGSAVVCFKEELTAIHGSPYTGRAVENGTEDMAFSVKPETFFLTNYNLRRELGLDYRYQCQVIYTLHAEDGTVSTRTITYTGIDPMGWEEDALPGYLIPAGETPEE